MAQGADRGPGRRAWWSVGLLLASATGAACDPGYQLRIRNDTQAALKVRVQWEARSRETSPPRRSVALPPGREAPFDAIGNPVPMKIEAFGDSDGERLYCREFTAEELTKLGFRVVISAPLLEC